MRTLQITGTLLLLAGLAIGSVGAYRFCTNLPLSDEKVLQEARKAVPQKEGTREGPRQQVLREKVELDVWTSALKMTNKRRKEIRDEAVVFLVSGLLSVMWGIAVLYNGRTASKDP